MSVMTNLLENEIINRYLRNTTALTPVATVFMSLLTTMPAADDGLSGVEVTGGSYARQATTFNAPSAGGVTNSADVTFTNLPACTVLGIAILDGSTASGLTLFFGTLTTARQLASGDDFKMRAGALSITLD